MVVRRHRHRTEHIRGTVMLLHFSFITQTDDSIYT